MSRLCLLVICVGLAAGLDAHPAIGIVMDPAGAVFYSDAVHVWRVDPDGTKTIAVRDVHTHELWVDAEGNVYGEHLWGGAGWRHRVWRRSPDGKVADIIAARSGLLEDYKDFSFTRDGQGALYWLERGTNGAVVKRRGRGALTTIAKLPLTQPGWLSVLPDGTVFLAENGALLRVAQDGSIEKMPAEMSISGDRYSVMAVWADHAGSVYAAVYGMGAVKKLSPTGAVSVAASCPSPWKPTGGFVAPDGALWILEASPTNAQRVRRVDASGADRAF
jgi:streptogramin lyase